MERILINCGPYLAVFLLASFARFSFALFFIIALTRSALEVNVGSEYYNGKYCNIISIRFYVLSYVVI